MARRSWTRRDFVRFMGIGAGLLAGCRTVGPQRGGKRPNILFIMTDDHSAAAMSCYGSRINRTPNLDRLAQEGMRFDSCFCTNSICAPSRATILSGTYSHINGVVDNRLPFDGNQVTFPQILQQEGYETAVIGKWHLKDDPTGFDYWNVLPGQGVYHDPDMLEMGERKPHKGYVTDIITDLCLDWLRSRSGEKPFCLMYHHKAPHRNWQPDTAHADLYEDVDIPVPDTFDDDYNTRSAAAHEQEMTIANHLNVPYDTKIEPPEGLEGEALKNWKYQRYIKDYLRCVASVDENVGRMLDYLDESGLTENTVVVYTSDQGFYLGEHGWFDKRFMYEESLRMPLLVRYPKEIQPGSINNDIVLNIDFAPTFLDFANASVPTGMQGTSFRRILQGDTPSNWRQSMYYHYYEYPAVHMVKRHYGVRTERYKLIRFYYDIEAWELYDLEKDPHELVNRYEDPAYATVVEELKQELERLRKQYGDSEELASVFLKDHLIYREEKRRRQEAQKSK